MPDTLELIALPSLPLVRPGDDLAALLIAALDTAGITPRTGDVLVLAQKIVSKAEGRYVDLTDIEPTPRADHLAAIIGKDPRLVEIILRQSRRVVRHREGVLIVEHNLGFVMANAGIDRSNIDPESGAEPVLLLPENPDAAAAALHSRLARHYGAALGVIVSDSFGRAWRRGTVGIALGAAGLPSLMDMRGRPDLYGRTLQVTETGFADEIAAAASLLMGQADEALPAVLVRGLRWTAPATPAAALVRAENEDLLPLMARDRVLALSGGVGGAKLALGLDRILPPGNLTVICNTGDDFEHLGLAVSPDLDTMTYVLAGIDNQETGWGRRGETWNFMSALGALGGETWFRLGDGDLATHVERTRRLAAGDTLSAITTDFCRRLGIAARILPMSDDRIRTRLDTDEGWLAFQDYFVRRQCRPAARRIAFEGAGTAHPLPQFVEALADPRLRAVVICPSNPFISIEPVLALPGVREALAACAAPVVAVAPIIAGRAVKGPTAKIMAELGLEIAAAAVARRYADFLDAYVIEEEDAASLDPREIAVIPARTLMTTLADREALARVALAAADALAPDA